MFICFFVCLSLCLSVCLSVCLFACLEHPEFSQQPTSQVAIADDAISFTCSVLSSPEHTTFTWDTPVVTERGTFEIEDMDPEPNSDLEVGGVVSTSVLRIPNVEGRDSGLVRCWATQESEMLGTQVVVANATLSVLGEGGGREGGTRREGGG